MTTMNYFYLLIAVLCAVSIALVFTMRNYQTTNAIEVASNFTSTNSSDIQQDNSTEENKGKIISPNFPLRII
jgi:hypothetical protein